MYSPRERDKHNYIHKSTILNTRVYINNGVYDEPTLMRGKRASFKIIFSHIATTLLLSSLIYVGYRISITLTISKGATSLGVIRL